MRRARKVRVHLKSGETVEGLMTRKVYAGHYVLHMPRVLESAERTHELDGALEIPAGNVIFVQVLR